MTQRDDPEALPTKEAERHESPARDGTGVIRVDDAIPTRLTALPLNQRPVFPTMLLPLVIPGGRLAEAIRSAIRTDHGWVGFFLTHEPLDDGATYKAADLHLMGCAGRISKHQDGADGSLQVLVQMSARWLIATVEQDAAVVTVRGAPVRTPVDAGDPQVRAMAMAIVGQLKELVSHNPVYGEEIKMVLANFNHIDGPSRLADIAASLTTAKREELQQVLETLEVVPRMERVLALLQREDQLSQLKTKIHKQIEQKVGEQQRKFFLTEQLKSIKQELGLESDDKSLDVKRFREALDKRGEAVPAEVRQVAEEELKKLQLLDPASSEYAVVRTRLEWLTDLPWGVRSDDQLDTARLRQGLDADHFGLEDVKERIVEFVAVTKLIRERARGVRRGDDAEARGRSTPPGRSVPSPSGDKSGGIITLVGPPGTGKTSVGASIARQLGRKFFRFSLGGMRDEAEIKGHRRTYVGALPGKIVQALKRCGSMNPVILLDEVDKLGRGIQGDPASALLEVLDPEQNKDFLDHYLDVRVDLSQILFICTANDAGGIPEPLRDRMEVIRLAGYVEAEKMAIARDHLVPKQLAAHGLARADLAFATPALRSMVRDHAREAGVRHLEQLIAKVCRKVATAKAGGGRKGRSRVVLTPQNLPDYLGKPLMRDDELLAHPRPGVVTGLAWTALGGATLEIEAVAVPADKGGLVLTGQLGDVMKESASLARSYLMANADRLGLTGKRAGFFDRHTVHVHVPAGATPKDGPSAGVTIATALLSLATGRAPRRRLGMTGELTLTGRVYPIGGVREKLVAAKRAGLERVLLPAANERDWAELPELVRSGITVTFVETLDEVLHQAGILPHR